MASSVCGEVLKLDPGNAEAKYILARIAASEDKYEVAADLMAQICAVTTREVLHNDYYFYHAKADNLSRAVKFFRCLVKDDPYNYSAWYYLGLSCLDLGELEGSRQALTRATILRPESSAAFYHLAIAHQRSGSLSSAEANCLRALHLAPGNACYNNCLANILKAQGRADEAAAYYEKAIEFLPENNAYFSNCLMNFLCTTRYSAEHIFAEHHRWGDNCCKIAGAHFSEYDNNLSLTRLLRIGYVSSDFCMHPVAFFIEPLITLHDRAVVEIYLYANVKANDAVTEQLRQRRVVWRDIYWKADDVVCDMVRSDGIDILVDLGGHTKHNRLSVFARKPAPVQVSWLGYANTTGLHTVDYRFTDNVADPPGMTEQYHTEQLYRLPGSFLCYHPPLNFPELTQLPLLENGYITFVALNNIAKVNDHLFTMWAKVLKRVPGSRLMLKEQVLVDDPGFRSAILERFAEVGITADTLLILKSSPTVHEHLQRVAQGDIALDSYPYHGTTTTCEALWMGVPVVTRSGSVHVSRVSTSLLTSVGLPELIAGSEDEFVEIAVTLATDCERLKNYRLHLREMMQKSSLMDLAGFARKIEDAYRDVWQRWCQSNHEGES